MKSYGSVAPAALRRAPSAIDVYADDDASSRPITAPAAARAVLEPENDASPLLVVPRTATATASAPRSGLAAWSSWWSVVFFSWCESLTALCAERPLRVDDIWALDTRSKCLVCVQSFKTTVDNLRCVVRAFHVSQAGVLVASGLLTLASVACELASPVAVFAVVDAAGNGGFETLASRGTLWTAALLLARFLRSFLLGWADFLLNYALVRTAGPLNILLLESLLSGRGYRRGHSLAEDATNLFATDTKIVAHIIKVFHRMWALPLELVGLCVIFNALVGEFLAGVFVFCPAVYLVIQGINIRETWLFREWMRLSDRRFAELYGIFDQILGVKLNAWEDRVLRSVEAVRRDEQRVLRRHTVVRTLRMALTWAAPSLNLVATGLVVAYESRRTLTTPAQTFAAVVIFHGINDAFTELIAVLRTGLEFRVALARIQTVVPVASHVPTHLPFDFLTRDREAKQQCSLSSSSESDDASSAHTPVLLEKEDAVVLTNACFTDAARTASEPLLQYLSLRVKRGEFVVVHGKVGSGKSLLLSAVAGLLHKKRGAVEVVGSVAYCSQSPWIQSTTVRDNVLFGRAYDAERYWSVLSACELLPDIRALPRGDQTLVGSRSYVSLSSGQQSRLALARACYADADVYLLDSPLDSVDSIVQCEILIKCMGRLLQHKTIVLASHNPEVIMSEYVDRAIQMDNLEIVVPPTQQQQRRLSAGSKVGTAAAAAPSTAKPRRFESKRSRLLAASDSLGRQRRAPAVASASDTTRPRGLLLDPSVCLHPQVLEIHAATATVKMQPPAAAAPPPSSKRRPSAVGVDPHVYHHRTCRAVMLEYLSHSRSPARLVLVVLLHFVTQVCATASIYSFSRWMSQYSVLRNSAQYSSDDAFAASMGAFREYVFLVVASAVSFLVTAYATFTFSRGISDRLFRAMTTALLHARVSFFAETTVGKILNRYCRDLQAVDSSLQDCVFALLKTFFGCYCALFASLGWMSGHIIKAMQVPSSRGELTEMEAIGLEPVTSLSVWLAIMGVNFMLTSAVVAAVWVTSIRSNRPSSELFVMHREALSPVFTFVAESIAGKAVIRAFGADQRERMTEHFAELLDRVTRITWAIWCFEAWLRMRSLLLENVITGVLLVGLICFGHDADAARPATIGLLLLLVLNLRDDLKNVFVHWNALEKDVVCLQRVFEYIHVEPEIPANPELPLALVDPALWPRSGALSFSHVDFQYGEYIVPGHQRPRGTAADRLTLRDVSFQVQRGEKIGIIGRSGAGKSSLAMALLRVNNPTRGVVTLDGVDITRVDLAVLRSKVSYLPPNPVFCSGTVREFLDPFADSSADSEGGAPVASLDDVELWAVLTKTGLKASIRRVRGQLDAQLDDVVYAWSNGERQLLCLARALLLRARVIFLDEATTATDQETDFSVQRVVAQSLEPEMTLLCISHRIDAVLKLDKLLVISDGEVEGFGTVSDLVATGDGAFFDLLENAQLVY